MISNLVHTTRFWIDLHQVLRKSDNLNDIGSNKAKDHNR